MKKILMSAAVMVFAVSALSAQSPWFLGGSVGFDFNKAANKTKITTFSIAPQVGYMLNDNWGLTLDLGYATKSEKEDGEKSVTEYNTFGFAVGAIYKYRIVDKFFFAPTLQVGYARENEAKINEIGADLNFLRFEVRPSCHWGFNVNFGGLSYLNTKAKGADAANAFGLSIARGANVGFNYYF